MEQKIKFSIIGIVSDITPYIDLYQSSGFQIWRKALSMQRNLDNVPECKVNLSFETIYFNASWHRCLRQVLHRMLSRLKGRDASQIASSVEKLNSS